MAGEVQDGVGRRVPQFVLGEEDPFRLSVQSDEEKIPDGISCGLFWFGHSGSFGPRILHPYEGDQKRTMDAQCRWRQDYIYRVLAGSLGVCHCGGGFLVVRAKLALPWGFEEIFPW